MTNHVRHIWLVLTAAGIAVCTAGCSGINILDSKYRNYTVLLKASVSEENGPILEIVSEPQGWEARNDKPVKLNGYVGFDKKSYGSITLVLDEPRSGCTDNEATSATWVITKIALSKTGDNNSQKGSKFGQKQTGWLTRAFPKANDNGIVLDVSEEKGKTSFVVANRNNHKGRQWAYYEVTATHCFSGATATSDPAWQNGGNGLE